MQSSIRGKSLSTQRRISRVVVARWAARRSALLRFQIVHQRLGCCSLPVAEQPLDAMFEFGLAQLAHHPPNQIAFPVEESGGRNGLAEPEFFQMLHRGPDPDGKVEFFFPGEGTDLLDGGCVVERGADDDHAAAAVMFLLL